MLFEDERLLAVDKPPGVSMATPRGLANEDGAAAFLAACGEAAPARVLLVHRLDRGTSGVVLLAKTDEAHRLLSRAFQERSARKTYRALVYGHPVPARGSYGEPLARDRKDARKMAVREEGKPAVTRYETLRRHPGLADLRLFPETGRTHQIRVHVSAHGHPIAGDDLYGGATRWRGVRDAAARLLLSRLTHPLLHAESVEIDTLGVAVSAPLPPDYRAVLAALEAA